MTTALVACFLIGMVAPPPSQTPPPLPPTLRRVYVGASVPWVDRYQAVKGEIVTGKDVIVKTQGITDYIIDRALVEDHVYRAVDALLRRIEAGTLPARSKFSEMGEADQRTWSDLLRSAAPGRTADNLQAVLEDPTTSVGWDVLQSWGDAFTHLPLRPPSRTPDESASPAKPRKGKIPLPPQRTLILRVPGSLGMMAEEVYGPEALKILKELRAENLKAFESRGQRLFTDAFKARLANPKDWKEGAPVRFQDLDPVIQADLRQSNPGRSFAADTMVGPPKFEIVFGFSRGDTGSFGSIATAYR